MTSVPQPQSSQQASHDQLYIEIWQGAISSCHKKLEPTDLQRALGIKDANDFRRELDDLAKIYMDEDSVQVINLLRPVVGTYENFAEFFVGMMSRAVETSMMWGLLYLVVKLSFECNGGIIDKTSRILKEIGHKVGLLYDSSNGIENLEKIKGATVEINTEILTLWLNIILLLRAQAFDDGSGAALKSLMELYTEANENMNGAVRRIEKVVQIAAYQSRALDLEEFRKVLALNGISTSQSTKHVMIPIVGNKRFFGRRDILDQVDDHLQPTTKGDTMRSIALHGLGGVGKTQIALAYAYEKAESLDAVFWISAENKTLIRQSFTRIAVSTLKLEGATPTSHDDNVVSVLNWLQHTKDRWLLVFDNVDDPLLLAKYCWPTANYDGSVLVTGRSRYVAVSPVDRGIEVLGFEDTNGLGFLLHLLDRAPQTEEDKHAGSTLCGLLGGHPLAINQMAALINARRFTLQSFLVWYQKQQKRMHGERRAGGTHAGYEHALDTVWKASFESLEASAAAILGVSSMLAADNIPLDLFEMPGNAAPSVLKFAVDEYLRGDAIEQLEMVALVRPSEDGSQISLHRLVQVEYLYHANTVDRQAWFQGTAVLLRRKFPQKGAGSVNESEWPIGDMYLPHCLALINTYSKWREEATPIEPTLEFCRLLDDCTWYLFHNDFGQLDQMLDIWREALSRCSDAHEVPLLPGDLACLAGLRDVTAGDFEQAEQKFLACQKVRAANLPPNHEMLINIASNLGVAVGSKNDYKGAKDYFTEAETMYGTLDTPSPLKITLLNNNMGKLLSCAGDYVPAKDRFDCALGEATKIRSTYWMFHVHAAMVRLYVRRNELDKAGEHASLAVQLHDASKGSIRKELLCVCEQIQGLVSLKLGRLGDAIVRLEKVTAMMSLYKHAACSRARATFLLHRALLAQGDTGSAQSALEKARHLKQSLPSGKHVIEEDHDEAYDRFVSILER